MSRIGTVYAVDDDAAVLGSLRALLIQNRFTVQAFVTATDFLQQADLFQVGCLVTDLAMPKVDGLELQSRVIEADSTVAVVFVTGYANIPKTVQIMENGAVTLLEKPYDAGRLIKAVEKGLDVSARLVAERNRRLETEKLLRKLAPDEIQILECASIGMPNKAIASELGLSSRTVDRRRHSAFRKLQINSIAEFAVLRAHLLASKADRRNA